jgi:hypothetical protein
MASMLRRLWRPSHPLFWLWLAFNVLGAVCAWVARLPGIGPFGLAAVVLLALGNTVAGLVVARQLLRLPPAGAADDPPDHA